MPILHRSLLLTGLLTILTSCRALMMPPSELVEGEPMYRLLPPDGIPSIDEPRFVGAAAADSFLLPDEPVLGVVGANGTAKCYSAWHLDGHEIVNDDLDGAAIAATW